MVTITEDSNLGEGREGDVVLMRVGGAYSGRVGTCLLHRRMEHHRPTNSDKVVVEMH